MSNSTTIDRMGDKLYESEYIEDFGEEADHFCDLITALRLNKEAQGEILVSAIKMIQFCQRRAFKSGFALGAKLEAGVLADINTENQAENGCVPVRRCC